MNESRILSISDCGERMVSRNDVLPLEEMIMKANGSRSQALESDTTPTILSLIQNPPAGLTPEQADWIHRLILAIVTDFKDAKIAAQSFKDDDSGEWDLSILNRDD